jgi:TRAP-type transport system small permease protein
MLATIERVERSIARLLSAAGLSVLLIFAVATLLDGSLRFLIGHPIDAVRDLSTVWVAVAAASCVPLGVIDHSNIALRFLGPLLGGRWENAVDVLASIIALAVLGGMARQFFVHASQLAADADATWMLDVPTAPFWFWVDAMFWLAALCQATILLRLLGGGRLPHAAQAEGENL